MTCTLTARVPVTGVTKWTAQLTGNGRTLAGANKALSGVHPLSGVTAPLRPAPPMLGFPLDDQVEVVSSASGTRLHSYRGTQTSRVVLADDHVLVTTVLYRDGHCRYSVDGRDPDGDQRDWHLDGYDLRTSSGLGCEQRKDPGGWGRYAVAVGPDNHELLLDASTGGKAFEAGNGESIVDADGRVALVRTADARSVRAVDLSTGSTVWTRSAGKSVKVGLGPGVAIFVDPGADRLAAVNEQDGRVLLDAKSGATVLGYSTNGLVVSIGRTVGLLTYQGQAG
jgi:outer membrane protein assembly factor BamB